MYKLIMLIALLFPNLLMARQYEEPMSMKYGLNDKHSIVTIELPAVDVEKSLQNHKYKDYQAKPLRFALPNEVNVTTNKNGAWRSVPGGEIWQLRFTAKNATDMNFGISKFQLPKGVELHFLSFADNPTYFDGPYTSDDNKAHQQLWSAPLPGDDVGLELFVPEGISKDFMFNVSRVSTGFRDVFKRNGGPGLKAQKQGLCNNDVVCPVGDGWRDEIRSVAAYTVGGTDTCTGTLIMDAERTFTPFFLTAFHCGLSSGNAASVVTIWNYESANCGDLGGGSRLDAVSGSTFLASRSDVDSSLIQLSSTPPEAFGVHWAGWDRTGNTPLGSVGIHHPGVDEKAISFNTDALTTVNSCIGGGGSNTHWEVDNWEDGTTEPGSSGSGLWDPDNQRLIGMLSGGTASCSSITYDCYGKFSEAWDNGGADTVNLKPWLDPNDTGITGIDGSDEAPFAIIAASSSIEVCAPDDAVYNLNITQNDPGFSEVVTLTTSGLPGSATENFSVSSLTPPGSSILTVANTGSVSAGSYVFDIEGTSATENRVTPVELVVSAGSPTGAVLSSPADNDVNVATTPVFSWGAVPSASSYLLEVATDIAFSNVVVSATTNDVSLLSPTGLAANTQHYWRVTASNTCGSGTASSVYSFTTSNEICFIGPVAIADNSAAGVDMSLNIADSGDIDDLLVEVDVTHTWVGDLNFTLTHEDTGTSVVLMDRPGYAGSGFGCQENNVNAVFDDSSTTPVENECSTGGTAIAGFVAPEQPLSAFIGESITGDWTLNVSDNASGDTGGLNKYCLNPVLLPSDLIFANGFE